MNTFFSLARLLRVFGQKLLNGVAIRRVVINHISAKDILFRKRYIKTIYLLIIYC